MNNVIVYTAIFQDGRIMSTSDQRIGYSWNSIYYSNQKDISNKIVGFASYSIPVKGEDND